MCQRKRVYWACLHEDVNVTPPPPLLYCAKATLRTNRDGGGGSNADGNSIRQNDLKPCASIETLPLTAKFDLFNAVVHPESCEVCTADNNSITDLSGQETIAENNETSIGQDGANSIENTYQDADEVSKEHPGDLHWIMDDRLFPESPRHASGGSFAGEEQSSGSTGGDWFRDMGPASEGDFQLYDDDEDDRFVVEDDMNDIGSKG
ncbi:hypothetical protein K445DRAFT_306047 [Daldinia sp. EC12]|nr:hypothetical protein K445DRAFT_306047 [Daldinia sp. EC12]